MLRRLRSIASKALGPPQIDETQISFDLLADAPRVMVDVGAHQGGSLLSYAEHGWDVHAFEPDPQNRDKLHERVGSLPNVHIDPRAVSTTDGRLIFLYTSSVSSGISTLQPFHPSHRATASVTTVRLDTYLVDHQIPDVGFLKVDAEGHDLEVLRTFPWNVIHPIVVLCEFEDRKTVPLGHTHADIAEFLAAQGYSIVLSEWHPIIRYGDDHRWRRAIRYPATPADDAWGNIMAVDQSNVALLIRKLRFAGFRLRIRRSADRLVGVIAPR